jgi:hypothetical protein
MFTDDFKILEFINQWAGFEKAYFFSFTLNLIRIIMFYVLIFGLVIYCFGFGIFLSFFDFQIKGVGIKKIIHYFTIFLIIIFSNIKIN